MGTIVPTILARADGKVRMLRTSPAGTFVTKKQDPAVVAWAPVDTNRTMPK